MENKLTISPDVGEVFEIDGVKYLCEELSNRTKQTACELCDLEANDDICNQVDCIKDFFNYMKKI